MIISCLNCCEYASILPILYPPMLHILEDRVLLEYGVFGLMSLIELREEYIKHNENMKYSDNVDQDSVEDLDGKIYLLKLKINSNS